MSTTKLRATATEWTPPAAGSNVHATDFSLPPACSGAADPPSAAHSANAVVSAEVTPNLGPTQQQDNASATPGGAAAAAPDATPPGSNATPPAGGSQGEGDYDDYEQDGDVYEDYEAAMMQQQAQAHHFAGAPMMAYPGMDGSGGFYPPPPGAGSMIDPQLAMAAAAAAGGYHQPGGGFLGGGQPLPPPPSVVELPAEGLPTTPEGWQQSFQDTLKLQQQLIQKQIEEDNAKAAGIDVSSTAGFKAPSQQYHDHTNDGASSVAASVATTRRTEKTWAGDNAPPMTVHGNHRWKKQNNRVQKRVDESQKKAFEAFANALLHAVSPFMAPLRKLTRASLPHIKLDQRYGKRGLPHTAVTQFIVAPIVANYRPTHFHEVSPGDLLEYHHDLALIIKQFASASCLAISYGPDWKPFAIPFAYLSCGEYKKEVLKLCPQEVPNSKSEAVFEDDVVKDVTDVILSVDELQPLKRMSFADAMKRRVSLAALYDVFDGVFSPIGNYQIQIRDLNSRPSRYLVKTSGQVLEQLQAQGETVVIAGDDKLWDELPNVANTFQSGKAAVVSATSATAPSAETTSSAAKAPSASPPKKDAKDGKKQKSSGATGKDGPAKGASSGESPPAPVKAAATQQPQKDAAANQQSGTPSNAKMYLVAGGVAAAVLTVVAFLRPGKRV